MDFFKDFTEINSDLDDDGLLEELTKIVAQIKKDRTTVISIIGGAASGKTTLARNLSKFLGSADYLGTDDYLIGDREYRRKNLEGGDPRKKYDVNFLNDRIEKICTLEKGEVKVPRYDEHTGLAVAAGEENFPRSICKVNYLLIEGDFDFVEKPDLKIYFHVPDEIRLQNRIERDKVKRNEVDEEKTKENFELRQELQHIPFTIKAIDSTDVLITAKKEDRYVYSIYLKKE